MNRNQKIALGCGGAGCLGLIVVAIAGGLVYYFMSRSPYYRNYNYNVSTNRNTNTNDNSDFTTNRNDNSSNSNSSSSTSSSSLSDDDKHKLYQAAAMTGDAELVRRVSVKLGLVNDDYTPSSDYQEFLSAHVTWVMSNSDFIQSINSPAKARAYVNENFPE
ncbi:MAG TPA: hypothetical protein VFS90_05500 [Pyrinomonadaceae bacterium]|nr:hypothetical protein [Pyrinomonadaceae bacterium]